MTKGLNKELLTYLRWGNLEKVREVIKKGAKLQRCNPLHFVAYYIKQEDKIDIAQIIEFLIEEGIDINQKDSTGATALHYAIHKDNLYIAKHLIKYGADVNIEYKNKNSIELLKIHSEGNKEKLDLIEYIKRGKDYSEQAIIGIFADKLPNEMSANIAKYIDLETANKVVRASKLAAENTGSAFNKKVTSEHNSFKAMVSNVINIAKPFAQKKCLNTTFVSKIMSETKDMAISLD